MSAPLQLGQRVAGRAATETGDMSVPEVPYCKNRHQEADENGPQLQRSAASIVGPTDKDVSRDSEP